MCTNYANCTMIVIIVFILIYRHAVYLKFVKHKTKERAKFIENICTTSKES